MWKELDIWASKIPNKNNISRVIRLSFDKNDSFELSRKEAIQLIGNLVRAVVAATFMK